MCGIIGVVSTEGMKNRSLRKDFMLEGLTADAWRGWDSTGLAIVRSGQEKSEPTVYKRAVHGFDFIQLEKVGKLLNDTEKYSIILGHNRSATRGTVEDRNAHPFVAGNITLVHNGTIQNVQDLKVSWDDYAVDSHAVTIAMARDGEKKILEEIFGAFVLVWINSTDGTLNIARNDRKPLFMIHLEKENTMFFGSEDTLLWHLLARRGVNLDNEGFMFPKPGVHYKYDLKDLRAPQKLPFVLRQGWQKESTNHSHHHNPPSGGVENWQTGVRSLNGIPHHGDRSGTNSNSTPSAITRGVGGMSDADEIDEVRRQLQNQRLRDYKRAGRPTTAKRKERATSELQKLGLVFNEATVMVPQDWVAYKNQRDFGTVIGFLKKDPVIGIQVYNVRKPRFDRYKDRGSVFVRLVNVRRGPKNKMFAVAEEHAKMTEMFERKEQDDAVSSSGAYPQDSSKRVELIYNGPGGTRISINKFLEITKHGCGNCSQFVHPETHEQVLWLGQSPPSAICVDCKDLPIIKDSLGLRDQARDEDESKPFIGNIH